MSAVLSRPVAVPLAAIFAMQSVISMGSYSIPVVIPVAAPDLGIEPESVGFLVALNFVAAMVVGLATGALIGRLGPTQLFRALLVFTATAAAVLLFGSPVAAAATAVIAGFASGPMNPFGSHVLARVTDAGSRALVFSIKQCATPMGGMLAGTLLPPLMVLYGWRIAMLVIPLFALILIVLAPFGRLGGRDHDRPARAFRAAEVLGSLREALSDPAVRAVSIAGLQLAACQMALGTYLVVYLWREAGFSPAEAGLVFSALHVAGIASRIVLGFAADRLIGASALLVAIGVVLSSTLVAIAFFSPAWPVAFVYGVTVLAGASGNGWVGLFFAELARLAPAERIAEVAAGGQFVMYIGLVLGPLAFGALLHASGSFTVCFLAFAALALGSGMSLIRLR